MEVLQRIAEREASKWNQIPAAYLELTQDV